MISIIAAVAGNGVIGKNNLLPWHIPEDMQLFRQLTMGKPVIVGRRTFESLPNALDGRLLIVLTRNEEFVSGSTMIQPAHSIEDALELARQHGDEVMVAGGETVYEQFLPLAGHLYISHVTGTHEGDAFFPRVRYRDWKPQQTTHYRQFSFITYDRAQTNQPA